MSQQLPSEFTVQPWQGRGSLEQMVGELNRQAESKVDFVVDTRNLRVCADHVSDDRIDLRLQPVGRQANEFIPLDGFRLNEGAIGQLAQSLDPKIPTRFFRDLLVKQPGAAVRLTNELLEKAPARRLIRCLDGQVRAVLSNKYRVMDNFDLAVAALDTAREFNAEVIEASLSDSKMRLKITTRDVFETVNAEEGRGLGSPEHLRRIGGGTQGAPMPGGEETIHPVLTLSNSEVGRGRLLVRIGILRAMCVNMATLEDICKEVHLGGVMDDGIFSDETRSADSKVLMMKAQDGVRAAFQPEVFAKLVEKCKTASTSPIEAPSAAVDALIANSDITEKHRDSILSHFLKDYSQTRYGLAQAVARASQDVDDADTATDMEDIAGSIIVSSKLLVA